MGLNPEKKTVQYRAPAASAVSATSTEALVWANDTGKTWNVESASFGQVDAITGEASNYYAIEVHRSTSAGVHTDVVAAATFNSVGNSVVAYVGYPLTVSTTATNLVVDDGETLNVIATEYGGVNTTLSAAWTLAVNLVEGTGAGQ